MKIGDIVVFEFELISEGEFSWCLVEAEIVHVIVSSRKISGIFFRVIVNENTYDVPYSNVMCFKTKNQSII